MTHEEIQAERTRDYETLGRFLGLADMAAEHKLWLLTPEQAFQRLIEIRNEYRAVPVPTASEGSKAKEVKGDADCRPAGITGKQ